MLLSMDGVVETAGVASDRRGLSHVSVEYGVAHRVNRNTLADAARDGAMERRHLGWRTNIRDSLSSCQGCALFLSQGSHNLLLVTLSHHLIVVS